MRVALVHPYSWPEVRRGGERYLADLAWWLAGAGHDVEIVTGTSGEPSVTEEGGVVTHRLRHVGSAPLARLGVTPVDTFGLVVLGALRRGRFDVAHALTPTAALAARAAGLPTVYTVIGHPTGGQFGRRPLDRRLVAAAVRTATEVAALSAASAAQVRHLFGREASVVPPGVRVGAFPPDLGPRTGSPRVLFSADASDPRKGVHHLLAAFARVRDIRPDARLVLSGTGDHRWAEHGLGAMAGRVLPAVVDLGPGSLDEVPGRYRDATVTVLPARYEAFGLALVESLASGTPVVAADDGGMPGIVDDPAIGRLFTHGDLDALAATLVEVIDLAADPATPARCARHAARWSWDAIGPRHMACYERALRRPTASSA